MSMQLDIYRRRYYENLEIDRIEKLAGESKTPEEFIYALSYSGLFTQKRLNMIKEKREEALYNGSELGEPDFIQAEKEFYLEHYQEV